MASLSTIDLEEIDQLLDSLNTSTPDADNSELSSSQDTVSDDDERSTLLIDGMEYVETQNLARPIRKSSAKKSSNIWKLGIELKRVDDGVKFWQCTLCKKKKKSALYTISSTTGPFRHLKKEHQIVEVNKRLVRLECQANLDSEASDAKSMNSPIIHDFNYPGRNAVGFFSKILIDEFRLLFLQWIICCHLALSMVENDFFRSLIRFINRAILEHLPESSDTIRKWVISEYQRQKEIKKETIRKSRSRITISFDTWTAPFSKKHVISMIAHFVDENWERRHLQLSMSRLYGGHSGENLAAHIVPILRDWEIDNRIGFFITDNEASNGVAIDNVLSTVETTYRKADRSKRWIRCLPHTLNLVAQAFLLGDDPESFALSVGLAELRNDPEELQELWRSRGFIGKLTNIIRYIRRSPKQREEFERIKVDESGDIEWLAVEDIEDEQQLEVRRPTISTTIFYYHILLLYFTTTFYYHILSSLYIIR